MNEPKLVIIGNFFPNVPIPTLKIKSRPVGYIIIVGLTADDWNLGQLKTINLHLKAVYQLKVKPTNKLSAVYGNSKKRFREVQPN